MQVGCRAWPGLGRRLELPPAACQSASRLEGPLDRLAGPRGTRARASGRTWSSTSSSSADGRASFKGRSGALGDAGDRAPVPRPARAGRRRAGRDRHDASRALRTDHPGPRARERRRRRQAGAPSRSRASSAAAATIPIDIPLFAEPEARIVVFSPPDLDLERTAAAEVEVVRLDPGEMTLTTALRRLRSDYGVRSLLCEGGPTLFGRCSCGRARRRAVPDALAEAGGRRRRADDHQRPGAGRAAPLELVHGVLERDGLAVPALSLELSAVTDGFVSRSLAGWQNRVDGSPIAARPD